MPKSKKKKFNAYKLKSVIDLEKSKVELTNAKKSEELLDLLNIPTKMLNMFGIGRYM